LNPLNWAMKANRKTASDSLDDNGQCLKGAARQNGLSADAQARCGAKQGTAYLVCMQDFLSAEPLGKDWSNYCAGENVQKTLKSASENLAEQKACTCIPQWVLSALDRYAQIGSPYKTHC
jgi:hypothetical protein